MQSESSFRVLLFQIFHMRLAVGHHGEETATRVIVLRVRFKVLGKFLDTLRQYGNLHFRRAGVRVVPTDFLDELLLFGLGNHPISIACETPISKPCW